MNRWANWRLTPLMCYPHNQPTIHSVCLFGVTCQQCQMLVCLFVHSVDCKGIFKLQNKYQGLQTDMLFLFLLNQDTRLFPRKKNPLEVLFLSSKFPTQSTSVSHQASCGIMCLPNFKFSSTTHILNDLLDS